MGLEPLWKAALRDVFQVLYGKGLGSALHGNWCGVGGAAYQELVARLSATERDLETEEGAHQEPDQPLSLSGARPRADVADAGAATDGSRLPDPTQFTGAADTA